jgi:hypothetical protein
VDLQQRPEYLRLVFRNRVRQPQQPF